MSASMMPVGSSPSGRALSLNTRRVLHLGTRSWAGPPGHPSDRTAMASIMPPNTGFGGRPCTGVSGRFGAAGIVAGRHKSRNGPTGFNEPAGANQHGDGGLPRSARQPSGVPFWFHCHRTENTGKMIHV